MGEAIKFGRGKIISPKKLREYSEGDIVNLNENGTAVEFYVAKHDYESGLNGTGRTLLVRKDCYDQRKWHTSGINKYATSSIDSWLNSEYKDLLDVGVSDVIDTTKIYYTPRDGDDKIYTLERSVFLLSAAELGKTASYANVEGTTLPIASKLQISYMNGSAVSQWTRSPSINNVAQALYLNASGNIAVAFAHALNVNSRPCFTLPSTAKFDPDTNLFLRG